MRKFRIFLIDDDVEFRESVAEVLMEESYIVDEAPDGAKALQIMSNTDFKPDLLLVDLAMPHMQGLEFIEVLKKTKSELPIIVCSSKSGLKDDFSITTNAQVRKFLTKPVKIEDLLAAIKEILVDKG
jgi:DNA-binding response OmpR family regulator